MLTSRFLISPCVPINTIWKVFLQVSTKWAFKSTSFARSYPVPRHPLLDPPHFLTDVRIIKAKTTGLISGWPRGLQNCTNSSVPAIADVRVPGPAALACGSSASRITSSWGPKTPLRAGVPSGLLELSTSHSLGPHRLGCGLRFSHPGRLSETPSPGLGSPCALASVGTSAALAAD